eukprot:NODE_1251_length_1215_cov_59.871355_g1023_i0.p1 GENE.NODE_1251_length_1215_cov_59.871355_g1023_i0~~NODE_1251_length_1215_cov_59.871355_g1023_i0.p1  ORF type:complete len:259 (-),score=48.98 NODE_1251_length_1215_cov_59.871355_g1023_i0:133-909(-)
MMEHLDKQSIQHDILPILSREPTETVNAKDVVDITAIEGCIHDLDAALRELQPHGTFLDSLNSMRLRDLPNALKDIHHLHTNRIQEIVTNFDPLEAEQAHEESALGQPREAPKKIKKTTVDSVSQLVSGGTKLIPNPPPTVIYARPLKSRNTTNMPTTPSLLPPCMPQTIVPQPVQAMPPKSTRPKVKGEPSASEATVAPSGVLQPTVSTSDTLFGQMQMPDWLSTTYTGTSPYAFDLSGLHEIGQPGALPSTFGTTT